MKTTKSRIYLIEIFNIYCLNIILVVIVLCFQCTEFFGALLVIFPFYKPIMYFPLIKSLFFKIAKEITFG